MKIYTKTGDNGTTSLVGGTRVSKTDKRLEAYGTADELNSFVGLLRAKNLPKDVDQTLNFVQNKLFNLGACLATEPEKVQFVQDIVLKEDDVLLLEKEIDAMSVNLPTIHSFILPAGSETVALCHVCRTITRRLERRIIDLQNDDLNHDLNVHFVNRLSDYLFILSKKVAKIDNSAVFLWEK